MDEICTGTREDGVSVMKTSERAVKVLIVRRGRQEAPVGKSCRDEAGAGTDRRLPRPESRLNLSRSVTTGKSLHELQWERSFDSHVTG